jgi:hypothetical protein
MAGIKDYSTTQANNTSLNGINTAEGMLPSNLNNAIRALMKNTREWYNDSQWVEYGDGDAAFTAAYASATSFTIAGVDVTLIYHAGRRIKLTASTPGTIYGTISSSTFSTNTTINVTWDSGSLSSEAITNVYIGALSKTNNSIPTGIISTAILADGSVTTAKIANSNITVAKMAANSVDSDQYVDGSIDTIHIASAQVTADKIATDAVTTVKINADAITGAKIADDQIDSEHYVDGSIDTVHIADSQITVAKMAANSVDSDQYVDGSIDTIHIADSQITVGKMAANSVDSDQYVDGSIDTIHITDANITLAKLASDSVNSSKIVDGSIVNADINASAAIDATKIHDGAVSNAEFAYVNGVTSAIQTQIDAKAATTYVDNAVAGLRTRIIAECASTANVVISSALEAGDVIDGVTLVAGDRVLLKDQSTATENGLYLAVASGAASRDPEHDTIAELSGGMVITNQGTANDNKIFLCTTDTDATLGSTSITYTTITPQNVGTVTSITAGTGLSGGAITSSGTIAIDSTVATLTGTQTLTNKTLTSPVFSGTATSFTSTGIDDNATSTAITINSSEQVEFTAGTVSLPSITTTGDTNTGIFFPAADTIAFTEGGTEAMRINSSGDVQIGSTNAGVGGDIDLSIGNTSSSGGITLWSTTTASHSIGFGDGYTGTDRYRGYLEYNHTGDSMRFGTSATERMRIDSSGNVGIGTSSPDAKLSVNGVASFGDGTALLPSVANFGDLNTGMWFPAADTIAFSEGGAEAMRIDSSGNVGIGTSTTTYKLTVQDSADNQDLIRLNHPSAATAGAMLGFTTDGTTDNNIFTLGVEYSAVDYDVINIQRSTQNVGIGETAPLGKLHVKSGDSGVSSPDITDLVVECSGSGGMSLLGATTGQVEIAFGDSGDANIGRIAYNHNENFLATVVNASEVIRTHSNGVTAFNNGIALGVGTANTASNVLDDYEEGTFTPIYRCTGDQLSSVTYNAWTGGTYTKVGQLVTVTGAIASNAVTQGSPSGQLRIGGLPFTVRTQGSTLGTRGTVAMSNQNLWATNNTPNNGYVVEGTTEFDLKILYGNNDDAAACGFY